MSLRLPELHDKPFIEDAMDREVIIRACIDAYHGNGTASAYGFGAPFNHLIRALLKIDDSFCFLKHGPVGFHTYSVDGYISASAVCKVTDMIHEMFIICIQHLHVIDLS